MSASRIGGASSPSGQKQREIASVNDAVLVQIGIKLTRAATAPGRDQDREIDAVHELIARDVTVALARVRDAIRVEVCGTRIDFTSITAAIAVTI